MIFSTEEWSCVQRLLHCHDFFDFFSRLMKSRHVKYNGTHTLTHHSNPLVHCKFKIPIPCVHLLSSFHSTLQQRHEMAVSNTHHMINYTSQAKKRKILANVEWRCQHSGICLFTMVHNSFLTATPCFTASMCHYSATHLHINPLTKSHFTSQPPFTCSYHGRRAAHSFDVFKL